MPARRKLRIDTARQVRTDPICGAPEELIIVRHGQSSGQANRSRLQRALQLHQAGKIEEAERAYLDWLASHPQDVEGTYYLAGLRQAQGRFAESVALFRQVLQFSPGHAAAWLNLGVSHKALGELVAAAQCFERAVALQPTEATAHYNLGVVLQELRRPSEALSCLDRAIALRPAYAKALSNRGSVLGMLRRKADALESLDRALALQAQFPQAHCNRAAVLLSLNRDGDALDSCDRALALVPDYPDALANRGIALCRMGRFEEGIASLERALRFKPEHVDANFNLALVELRFGRYAQAWPRHEYRWKLQREPYRHGTMMPWRGGAQLVAGRRVLLWSEQGLGDTLQFCRYAPIIAAFGAEVVMEVPSPLVNLLSSLAGVSRVIAQGEAVEGCDFEVPLLSLPLAMNTTLETIPASTPYLTADPDKVIAWRARLGEACEKPRVGIVCSGNPTHDNDATRSLPLSAFAPLFGKAQLCLLQKDVRPEDEATLRDSPLLDLRVELKDFSDTAALVECMDVVISVDTSVVHLAGALGKPVWVLLAWSPDWRWMSDRLDSPWYPSARLFRQSKPGVWTDPIENAVRELSFL